jgi:hypothetical protein
MTEEVDFERLRRVFTPENAIKKFRPKTLNEKEGEYIKAYFTPTLEPEEITVILREKSHEGFQFTIRRIFQDAVLLNFSYSWEELDFEHIEETIFMDKELTDLCSFL